MAWCSFWSWGGEWCSHTPCGVTWADASGSDNDAGRVPHLVARALDTASDSEGPVCQCHAPSRFAVPGAGSNLRPRNTSR